MPKIIQFTHPGPEHKPDKKGGQITSWNKSGHKRKFIETYGKFVDEGGFGESKLAFWGEWEPPSQVTLLNQLTKEYPRYLHRPFLPNIIPTPSEKEPYQNTDPFVFDKHFKYFICKQFKTKNKQLTSLANLEKGSIILFGSTKGKKRENAFFMLDTVFVVGDRKSYHSSMEEFPFPIQHPDYQRLTINMTHHKVSKLDLDLSLYIGATPENPIDGMYSFSPSQQLQSKITEGFPRICLKDMEYITNNLNSSPKISQVTSQEVKAFFDKILKISRACGLVEGYGFTYSKEK